MHYLRLAATTAGLALTLCLSDTSRLPAAEMLDRDSATHKPTQTIKPTLAGQALAFHTFALSPERELWLCCTDSDEPKRGKLLVYAVDGQFLRAIDVDFVPQAIGFASSAGRVSAVFVAGSGRVAKLTPSGETVQTIDAPNIGNREEVMAALREQARKQSAEMLASIEKQSERVKKQVADLEQVPADETPEMKARRQRRLKLLTQQVKQIQLTIDSVISGEAGINENSLANLARASGLAVTGQYLFIALPAPGSGYDVWRLNHELGEAKKVLSDGSGCCGQFDIQTDGQHLVVAQNCDFSVGYYDVEGQSLKKFGKRSATDADGFGSCCNPMNVCCEGDEVLTAESSIGHIKRFSADGKLLAYIGTAPIGGGCKHVALAHDRSSDRYFMFNQDRKCITVLVPKSQASEESAEERSARLAMAGLGQKLIGQWKAEPVAQDQGISSFFATKYGQLNFAGNGELSQSSLSEKTTLSGETLAALSKLAGSLEAAQMLSAATAKARWQAIEQNDDELRISLSEDGVTSFEAKIQFQSADTLKLQFFYGSSEPVAELNYRKAQ